MKRFRVTALASIIGLAQALSLRGTLILENFHHILLFQQHPIPDDSSNSFILQKYHTTVSLISICKCRFSAALPHQNILLTTATPKNLEMFVCCSSNDSESDMPTVSCSCPPDMYHIDVSVFCCVPVLTLKSTSVCLV